MRAARRALGKRQTQDERSTGVRREERRGEEKKRKGGEERRGEERGKGRGEREESGEGKERKGGGRRDKRAPAGAHTYLQATAKGGKIEGERVNPSFPVL